MLLLGLKSDLREHHANQIGVPEANEGTHVTTEIGDGVVSEQQGRRMAEALGALGYIECSAKQDIDSVHKLFKVFAMISISYTGCAKSDQTHGPDYGNSRGSTSAWKNLFSMPVTRN
jgi:hypothetical protein